VNGRFKAHDADESALITHVARGTSTTRHLPFAAAIAEFGLLLRDGDRTRGQWDDLHRRALAAHVPASLVADKAGFIELVETAQGLSRLRR
jgi:hypothetical protein